MGLNQMMKRRQFFKGGVVTGAWVGITGVSAEELPKTASETSGPFHPVVEQKDKDFDLTKVEGRDGVAKGKVVELECSVVGTDGKPVEEATVEIWQANAAGRYHHPHDKNPAPLDSDFQGWAIVPSGKEGKLKFKTIVPGSYPASKDWSRPPHIHFKVTKMGYMELTTQMYFPGENLNDTDLILQKHTPEQREQLIAKLVSQDPPTYGFRIVIEKV
jgi:protocatechuate 3,4-dioxygenase beta subunit